MKSTTQDLVQLIQRLQSSSKPKATCPASTPAALNTSILAESLVKEVSGGKMGTIEVFGKWSRS